MNELVVAGPTAPALPDLGEFYNTSWQPPTDMTYDEWERVGSTLQTIQGSINWWVGDWLNEGEKRYGETYAQAVEQTGKSEQFLMDCKWVANKYEISDRSEILDWTHHQIVASLPRKERQDLLAWAETNSASIREIREEKKRRAAYGDIDTPPLPDGRYRCIVIDPPWPVKKIEREVRPNQSENLDYPTMSLERISALPIGDLAALDGCHLYLWTTQKYLPDALDIIESWGFSYQCLMTWRKNVGITPFSWMYDTEHVVFARLGNLPLERLGLRLSFDAPVTKHSEKPNVFFDERVILVSPEPRIEMFARKERTGFTVWGNEV